MPPEYGITTKGSGQLIACAKALAKLMTTLAKTMPCDCGVAVVNGVASAPGYPNTVGPANKILAGAGLLGTVWETRCPIDVSHCFYHHFEYRCAVNVNTVWQVHPWKKAYHIGTAFMVITGYIHLDNIVWDLPPVLPMPAYSMRSDPTGPHRSHVSCACGPFGKCDCEDGLGSVREAYPEFWGWLTARAARGVYGDVTSDERDPAMLEIAMARHYTDSAHRVMPTEATVEQLGSPP